MTLSRLRSSQNDQTHRNQRILISSFHCWLNFYDRTKTFHFMNVFYHEWRFSPGGGSALDSYMDIKLSLVFEGLITLSTLIWFLFSMSLHVGFKNLILRDGHDALVYIYTFFDTMYLLMIFREYYSVRKPCHNVYTDKVSLICVSSNVSWD